MNMIARTDASDRAGGRSNRPTPSKRIVFLGTAHDNGGSSILAGQLAVSMRARGHHVEEWYLFGSSDDAGQNAGTRIFHKGDRTSSPLALFRILLRLTVALRNARPDAVFGLQPLSNLLAGLCGRLAGVPRRISTLHLPRSEANPALMTVDRMVGQLGFFTRVVACGATVGESYRNNGKHYARLIEVIPNGQPKPRLPARSQARADLKLPDGRLIGQIGRMSAQKNQSFSVDLLTELSGVSMFFLGSGPTEPTVRAQVSDLGLDSRTFFQSAIPNAQIGSFYAAVDLILFPSRYEGLSLAAIEAVHAGVPLLCSDIPSFRELFDHSPFLQDTLLISLDDGNRWLDQVRALLEDSALRAKVSAELQQISASYSFETMAARYLELLDRS